MVFDSEFLPSILSAVTAFFSQNRAVLVVVLTSAIGSALGAYAGAGAIFSLQKRQRHSDIEAMANVSIASMIALLGKLINFKKDNAFPAQQEAAELEEVLASLSTAAIEKPKTALKLDLWAETSFTLMFPENKIFELALKELDIIQLIRMLEFNLCELDHYIRQRNTLIRQLYAGQTQKGVMPAEGLKLYIKYTNLIARNTDENLFFLDKTIEKIRAAARKLLPKKLHRGIADVGLAAETQTLMPPKDLIKGWLQ